MPSGEFSGFVEITSRHPITDDVALNASIRKGLETGNFSWVLRRGVAVAWT